VGDKVQKLIRQALNELTAEQSRDGGSRRGSIVRTKLEEALLWRAHDPESVYVLGTTEEPEVLNG